jgi:hypothetical protein
MHILPFILSAKMIFLQNVTKEEALVTTNTEIVGVLYVP